LSGSFAQLSARQIEVLELIARALDNDQIASQLSLSEKTVRNHIAAIFSKLEVRNRAQAIVRARTAGFGRAVHPFSLACTDHGRIRFPGRVRDAARITLTS
jgi:DNA-binding CsgD family transcriptional regulator